MQGFCTKLQYDIDAAGLIFVFVPDSFAECVDTGEYLIALAEGEDEYNQLVDVIENPYGVGLTADDYQDLTGEIIFLFIACLGLKMIRDLFLARAYRE